MSYNKPHGNVEYKFIYNSTKIGGIIHNSKQIRCKIMQKVSRLRRRPMATAFSGEVFERRVIDIRKNMLIFAHLT